ncbi:hypothetical protein [Mesorhizobium sp. NZP2298]|uniref:hypothetical protein n=1 Tax=Mesorhizobium sp. NZP2298 TaxID=2483403 RepID=UPI0015530423|nr:hypothetical protein [Mesorhizobium sp. NZP2298]QKC98854.1 hypothetical protein EB231_32705 [Mesorhizobium sp. NZP2298]
MIAWYLNLAENSGTSIHANVGVDLPTDKQKAAQQERIIAPKAARMRLSVVLFFVPTDFHAATTGLMTALMPPDHGGAG